MSMTEEGEGEWLLQQANDAQLGDVLPAILFISVLMVFGCVGNALVFYIYMFRFKPSTLRIFIISLSALDTAICGFNIPVRILVLRYKFTFGRYSDLCKGFYTLHDFMFLTSMYMLISVAVERYKKVCYPLNRQMTVFSAKVTVGVCALIAFLFALPAAFKYGTKTIALGAVNGTQCYIADHHDPTLVKVNYVFWIITNIGVLTTLIALYCLIWRRVNRQLRYRKNSRAAEHRPQEILENSSESVDQSLQSHGEGDSAANGTPPINKVLSELRGSRQTNLHRSVSDVSHKTFVATLARKQSQWKAEDRRLEGVRKMTTVMFLVTLVSIVAYLPVVTKMITRLFDPSIFRRFKFSVPWFYNVYVYTFYIQCAANPLIYSFRNTRFRREVTRLFVKRRMSISSSRSDSR